MTSRCRICKQPLTDERSIARGMGVICFLQHGAQLDMFAPQPPSYTYEVLTHNEIAILVITDRHSDKNPSMTVTNGAELVLAEIAQRIGSLPPLIIYRDSEGVWDRMKAKPSGAFTGFAPLYPGAAGITNRREAIELAVAGYQKQHKAEH